MNTWLQFLISSRYREPSSSDRTDRISRSCPLGSPGGRRSYYLKTALNLNEVAAYHALGILTQRGVLVERTAGLRRNRVWQQNDVLNVLDEYATAIRRVS